MRIMAQMAMVMNLDKCMVYTARSPVSRRGPTATDWSTSGSTPRRPNGLLQAAPGPGQVEGLGLGSNGRLKLKAGGRFHKLINTRQSIDDYYEPWTYDYANLLGAPAQKNFPVARLAR